MITNELLAFVKEELSKGTTEDEIKKALMEGGGWSDMDIKEAFDAVGIYSQTYQGTMNTALAATTNTGNREPVVKTIEHAPLESVISRQPAQPQPQPEPALNMRERLVLPMTKEESLAMTDIAPKTSIPPHLSAPATPPAPSMTSTPVFSSPIPSGMSTVAPKLAERPSYLTASFGQNQNKGPQQTFQAPLPAAKKGHSFLYFIIFLIILLALLVGGVFAYWKGMIPGVSLLLLDDIGKTLGFPISGNSLTNPGGNAPEGDLGSGGLAINDPGLIPAAPIPAPPAQQEPPPMKYYSDRIRITLPSGSPVSATTVASSVAAELRGKVFSCEYGPTENSCIIIVPLTKDTTLESIIKDLKTDTRLKGSAMVEI